MGASVLLLEAKGLPVRTQGEKEASSRTFSFNTCPLAQPVVAVAQGDITYCGQGPPSSVIIIKCPIGLLTGQSSGDVFSIEVPSFKNDSSLSLIEVKLASTDTQGKSDTRGRGLYRMKMWKTARARTQQTFPSSFALVTKVILNLRRGGSPKLTSFLLRTHF